MSVTTSSALCRSAWRARRALAIVSVVATLAACSSSLDLPENQQNQPTSQVEPDENETDEVEPDENERNENERNENERAENERDTERDENEPDDSEQNENAPDDTEERGSDD